MVAENVLPCGVPCVYDCVYDCTSVVCTDCCLFLKYVSKSWSVLFVKLNSCFSL